MPQWLLDLSPILILLAVVAIVISRLPKVEGVDHEPAYLKRRLINWLPLGLTYAFLYMGRYNIKVSQHAFGDIVGPDGGPLMSNADFATIFAVGTGVYGFSFLINGPFTDRFGGRLSILIGAGGSLLCNLFMGLATLSIVKNGAVGSLAENFVLIFSLLYGVNMYFQSFGAVAVVKTNAPWFHVRERGVFGAIFGILISLGVYFAYDWGYYIIKNFELHWVFLVPTVMLAIFWVLDFILVQNAPEDVGFSVLDTGDASSGDDGPQLGAIAVFKMMLKNPVIMTIACIEFCSGFLRQAIMQWYRTFAKQTDGALSLTEGFIFENWGLMLCCAGILGGVIAGVISDHLFQSRRGPVAGLLYLAMLVLGVILSFTYDSVGGGMLTIQGILVVLMSMCIIAVHGMLSGTASMDFGGKKNVGVAVGIIDGFVYAGTAVMSITYALILPQEEFDEAGTLIGEATNPAAWQAWPLSMLPLALIGFVLCLRVWNAKPKGKGGGH